MVADSATSADDEGARVRADAAFGAGAGAAVGPAEATGRDAAGRAATGVFFLATGFFGGFTACRVT